MDHVECAGAFFRLLVDRRDDRTSGFESEAEEDGLRGRIRLVIALGRPSFAQGSAGSLSFGGFKAEGVQGASK